MINMAISLSKGGNVSLSKEDPTLDEIMIGLGWDARATDGTDFDLDASAFLLAASGKVRSDITLSKLPADIDKVAIAVTIHDGEARRQSFGQVSNAFIRLVNQKTGAEVVRYDLSEDASVETAMILGEVYRHGSDFKFRAVGQGFKGGLGPLATNYGVSVG
jgi:tellurium resistance protein TerD